MKQEVILSYYSEDGATVGEAGYWYDDEKSYNGKSFRKVDSIYIGETDWQYNKENCLKELTAWENKLSEKHIVIKRN